MVNPGVEVLLSNRRDLLQGKRVGLVSNYSVTDSSLNLTVDLLSSSDDWILTTLFGPEHGMKGCAKEGEDVAFEVDTHTGLRTYSLYGQQDKPTPEMFHDVDVLVIDLHDVGSRYYTNISTMVLCLEACAELAVPCIVLDRPNPIDGVTREGNILSADCTSFVGMLPIPNRHGLTIGELAKFANSRLAAPCDLTVVPMTGWWRDMLWPDTGLPFVAPSPNTTGFHMMLLYPGTCLIEGTNLSEGRGTARPFEFIGAPFADAHEVAYAFNCHAVPGVVARPVYFVPTYKKHVGQLCDGVQLHVTAPAQVQAVRAGLVLLDVFSKLYPGDFSILSATSDERPCFLDLLSGSDELRHLVNSGQALDYLQASEEKIDLFSNKIQPFYLY